MKITIAKTPAKQWICCHCDAMFWRRSDAIAHWVDRHLNIHVEEQDTKTKKRAASPAVELGPGGCYTRGWPEQFRE